MQAMQPCARCEQELPDTFFDSPDSMYCKRCMKDITDIIRRKYSVIEAAHFRAQLRQSTRRLRQKLKTGSLNSETAKATASAGAGD